MHILMNGLFWRTIDSLHLLLPSFILCQSNTFSFLPPSIFTPPPPFPVRSASCRTPWSTHIWQRCWNKAESPAGWAGNWHPHSPILPLLFLFLLYVLSHCTPHPICIFFTLHSPTPPSCSSSVSPSSRCAPACLSLYPSTFLSVTVSSSSSPCLCNTLCSTLVFLSPYLLHLLISSPKQI